YTTAARSQLAARKASRIFCGLVAAARFGVHSAGNRSIKRAAPTIHCACKSAVLVCAVMVVSVPPPSASKFTCIPPSTPCKNPKHPDRILHLLPDGESQPSAHRRLAMLPIFPKNHQDFRRLL